MNGFKLNWRMAAKRKASGLLVIAFTAAVSLFLLLYPTFIESTRKELDHAYDSIDVTGWLINLKEYSDPTLYGVLWQEVLDTGIIGEHDSYATLRAKVYEKGDLLEKAQEKNDDALLAALNALLEEEKASSRRGEVNFSYARGVNRMKAERELSRQQESILWADGMDESCLAGNGMICLLPEELGWLPGDKVPVYVASMDVGSHVTCLTVAGIYTNALSDNVEIVLPLATVEAMSVNHWLFYVNSFNFTVSDNRQLPALKAKLIEMTLHGVGELGVRVAIDDRILDGTVSPIQSNLALLEGLYRFFFIAVIAIGFFLCFLMARGRKAEFAVMRMLGESRLQVTMKALLEQASLCLAGILLGAMIFLLVGRGAPDPATCGIILGCYTLGAALAVLLTIRVDVMDILRDKE